MNGMDGVKEYVQSAKEFTEERVRYYRETGNLSMAMYFEGMLDMAKMTLAYMDDGISF